MNYWFNWEGGGQVTIWMLVAAASVVGSWYLLSGKPRRFIALRIASILLLFLSLAKIILQKEEPRSIRPRVAILIDNGLTMSSGDGSKESRLLRAVHWLQSNRRSIENRAEPILYSGSDRARRISWDDLNKLTPADAGFDLGADLKDVSDSLVSEPGGAARMWLLGDGNSESNGDMESSLLHWKASIDSMGVGPKATAKSVGLDDLKTPDFVFLHSRFNVSLAIEANQLQGAPLKISLWKGSSLLSEQTVGVREPYEVLGATFAVVAESLGREKYRVEVSPAQSEGTAGVKASKEFGIEVIRQKHRIMYLAGRPGFEYVHLREQLKGNPNFELVSFVILRNPENIAPVADNELSLIPFPAQEIFVQSLSQFDIFILENFAYWRFNLPPVYLENLKHFVSQGGALLVLGGSNSYAQGGYRSSPLEEVLPVSLWNNADDFVPGLFKPNVNALGHPMLQLGNSPEDAKGLWDNLPPLDGFNRFSAVKPGSTVLLTHPSEKMPSGAPMPVLAIRDYGKGKVMVLGTDSTWRWKLGGGEYWKTSAFYGRFWERSIQYLTGTLDLKKVKFSPLPDRLPPREPAVITLHLFDEAFKPLAGSEADLRVQWTSPDGKSQAVVPREREPGIFDIELTGLQEGAHRLHAIARYHGQVWGEDEVRFKWDLRASQAPLQRKQLKELSHRTGGQYADLERVPLTERLDELPQVRMEREVLQRWPLWDSSVWLWAIFLLLMVEWYLRRKLGYV